MSVSQLRKHIKFKLIHYLRQWKYKKRLNSFGKGVFIERNVQILRYPSNVSIGDHVVVKEGARICSCNASAPISIGKLTTIGYHTFIFASSQITIGDNCLIAPFVYIVDSDHQIAKGLLINQQPNDSMPISIGNDVWVGTGAKILKGVTIDDGAVIAAGAVLTSSVGPNEIFGGVPAKKIGERS